MGEHILVMDEGTTSTRAMLFDLAGKCLATSQRELTQYYPETGHVEHDAGEIWDKTLACAQALVERAGGADRVAASGIAKHGGTVVAWAQRRGKLLGGAVIWADRMPAALGRAL